MLPLPCLLVTIFKFLPFSLSAPDGACLLACILHGRTQIAFNPLVEFDSVQQERTSSWNFLDVAEFSCVDQFPNSFVRHGQVPCGVRDIHQPCRNLRSMLNPVSFCD